MSYIKINQMVEIISGLHPDSVNDRNHEEIKTGLAYLAAIIHKKMKEFEEPALTSSPSSAENSGDVHTPAEYSGEVHIKRNIESFNQYKG